MIEKHPALASVLREQDRFHRSCNSPNDWGEDESRSDDSTAPISRRCCYHEVYDDDDDDAGLHRMAVVYHLATKKSVKRAQMVGLQDQYDMERIMAMGQGVGSRSNTLATLASRSDHKVGSDNDRFQEKEKCNKNDKHNNRAAPDESLLPLLKVIAPHAA